MNYPYARRRKETLATVGTQELFRNYYRKKLLLSANVSLLNIPYLNDSNRFLGDDINNNG